MNYLEVIYLHNLENLKNICSSIYSNITEYFNRPIKSNDVNIKININDKNISTTHILSDKDININIEHIKDKS